MEKPITYDRFGRMRYHPDYHENHGRPWLAKDEQYLIENYDVIGPEEVSFTLGRTIQTVMTYAFKLRRAGKMPPVPTKKKKHRRTFAKPLTDARPTA